MHINVTWLNYMEMHVSRFTQLMMLSSQIELAGAVAKKNTNTQGKDCPIFNNKWNRCWVTFLTPVQIGWIFKEILSLKKYWNFLQRTTSIKKVMWVKVPFDDSLLSFSGKCNQTKDIGNEVAAGSKIMSVSQPSIFKI